MILGGAYTYVSADAQFAMESWWAYNWVGLYFVIIVVEMTYGKMIVRDIKLSLSGSVAYSNALSLVSHCRCRSAFARPSVSVCHRERHPLCCARVGA